MSANLPILWADKEDSPELKAYLEQFSNKYYFTAAEINQLRDAVNEMAVIQQSTFMGTAEPAATPAGTGNRYWTAVSPGTYANFGGVVVAANSLAIISVTAAGVWSVSQTALNLSTYLKIVDGNKINFWAAQDYPIGTQINHLGKDWYLPTNAALSTDIPGTSSKWVERLSGYLENSDINKGTFDSTDNEKTASQKSIYDKNKPYFDNVKLLEQTDGFYLTDNEGNVIAKVTSAGIQSVAFLNKSGNSISGVSDNINISLVPDGFHFTDYMGNTVAKITKDGIQSVNYLDKDGLQLKSTSLATLIKGLEFYSLGDSLSAANLWQLKLAELTNSTFNATVNTNTPLSVGGTRTGGVNTTCGQWRAKLLFELNVNPKVIFIENINDLNTISSLGTIDDEPFMLQNIITYPTTFASLTALNTWLSDGSFATYLATFATIDRKIGSGIRFPYTNGTTMYLEYIFDSKIVSNWTTTSFWKNEVGGNTIYKSYKGLLEYLKLKFPTALIMWFAPTRIAIQTVSGQTGYNASFWNADGSFNITTYKSSADVINYQKLVDAQKKVCEYYSIPFINVNENCGINPFNFLTYYPQNNVHPLTTGYEKWGETIAKLI